MVKVYNDVVCALDREAVVILLLLDLSAAFDVVDHHILCKRIKQRFGIVGSAHQWLVSYLSERSQYVVIDDHPSESIMLDCGVPQGSVLGPLLFSMYTAPLSDIARKHGLEDHFYADDSQLYIAFKPKCEQTVDVVKRVEACVAEVKHWMIANRLKLNDDKTELIVFSTRRNEHVVDSIQIRIGDATIIPSPVVRDLGVFLDQHLTMESHVSKLRQSAYLHLRMIGRIRGCLTVDTTKSLMRNMILTRLDYCNALLVDIPASLCHKLQLLQNNAARVVYRLRKYDHVTPALISLHWLPMRFRPLYKLCLLVFKCLKGIAPGYVSSLISLQEAPRSLRSTNDTLLLQVPRSSLKLGERAFSVAAPAIWNSLPLSLRNEENIDNFKKNLKFHFCSLAFQD